MTVKFTYQGKRWALEGYSPDGALNMTRVIMGLEPRTGVFELPVAMRVSLVNGEV